MLRRMVFRSAGSHAIDIDFVGASKSGFYTIAKTSYPEVTTVLMNVDGKPVADGGRVYVQQVSPGVFDITICDVTVSLYDSATASYTNYTLTTKFRSPS